MPPVAGLRLKLVTFFDKPVVWLLTSVVLLAACTFLPLKIQNDALRNFVMRWVLVPVSLILILYSYPVGIEVFRKIAVSFK